MTIPDARCPDCGVLLADRLIPWLVPEVGLLCDRCGQERVRARMRRCCPEPIYEHPPRTRAWCVLALACGFLSAALLVAVVWWVLEGAR